MCGKECSSYKSMFMENSEINIQNMLQSSNIANMNDFLEKGQELSELVMLPETEPETTVVSKPEANKTLTEDNLVGNTENTTGQVKLSSSKQFSKNRIIIICI